MDKQWIEIPADLGAELWRAYTKQMVTDGVIHVHSSYTTDSYAFTEVGLRGGDTLLRLESIYRLEQRMVDGFDFPVDLRICIKTTYFLPSTCLDD